MFGPKIYECRCPVCKVPTYRVSEFMSVRLYVAGGRPTIADDGGEPDSNADGDRWNYPGIHCGRHTLGELRAALGMTVGPKDDPNRACGPQDTVLTVDAAREALAKARVRS